jgi:hypothetical protein
VASVVSRCTTTCDDAGTGPDHANHRAKAQYILVRIILLETALLPALLAVALFLFLR